MDKRRMFTSHKHRDRAIADVVSTFFEKASAGQIEVYQSSNPAFEGPKIGESISKGLLDVLARTDLVVLVYTGEGDDWAWCMWECGVATDPSDTTKTRVIVLQCGDSAPSPYEDVLRVNAADLDSIRSLVDAVFCTTEMFRRHEAPLFDSVKHIEDLATTLHKDLGAAIPKPMEPSEVERLAPYLRIAVPNDVTLDAQGAPDTARKAVIERSVIVNSARIDQLLNVAVKAGETLETLGNRMGDSSTPGVRDWIEGIADQVLATVAGKFPMVRWSPYHPDPARAYLPIVATRLPNGGHSTYDVYLPRVASPVIKAKERMLTFGEVHYVNLADTDPSTLTLRDLIMDLKGRSRVPVLGEGDQPLYIIHKSMVSEFIGNQALSGSVDVGTLTLADLLAVEELADLFGRSFATVSPDSTIEDARVAMMEQTGCQDVFVTESGERDSAVLGWLTNVMFVQQAT